MVGSVDEKYIAAAHRALAAFPVTATKVDLVWQSENITFRVHDAVNRLKYVLRLHRQDGTRLDPSFERCGHYRAAIRSNSQRNAFSYRRHPR
jgi:hypothetical protein